MIHRASMMRFVHRPRWLPIVDSFRTLCLVPTGEVLAVFNDLESLTFAS